MLSIFLWILSFLYSAWWWCVLGLSVATIVTLVALARSDCDLVLAWYTKWAPKAQWPSIALQGKVIWITGASSGIGEHLAYHLAKCGAMLVLSARREGELQRVLERCIELSPDSYKGRHMALPMDLTEIDKHSSLVQTVVERYKKIDYLVNNAGRTQMAEATATSLAVDRALFELNVMGTISLTKAVLPGMIANREGCVVNVNSISGKIGSPGSAIYAASKHSLQGFFDTLRMELADKNISILSVCPGPIDTPILKDAFREVLSSAAEEIQPSKGRMSADRCAELMTTALASRLEEVWISRHPFLLFTYLKQYFPNFISWYSKRIGPKMTQRVKTYCVNMAVTWILSFFYSAWWWCVLGLSVATIVILVALARSDCDLVLAWYTKWAPKAQWPSIALQGKVIWITGASSGIGEHLAYHLAKCGAVLVLSARREGELQRVLERCKELSPSGTKERHMVLPMDLTETNEHSRLVQTVVQEFKKIDYLVNNAGRSQRAEAIGTELAVDRASIELNVMGTISLTKAVLPGMVEGREGCVVTISSVAGKMGAPGSASYTASKHALQGFFDTLRMEVADKNISILSVCPGPVDTPFLDHVFTEKLSDSAKNRPNRAGGDRVTAERCAELIAVTMGSRLDEVWIAKNPILFFVYMTQYFPNLARWLGKSIGNKRLHAIKSGLTEVDGSYFSK